MKAERIGITIAMVISVMFFIIFFVDLITAESHISTAESYCYQCGDSVNAEDNYCDNCGLGLNPQTIYKCGKCIYESELECEVCPICGCNVIVKITSGGGRIEKAK